MRQVKEPEEEWRGEWASVAPEIEFPQLGHLDGDGVNIQCVNSSEFVVGKQTNFNGPVTIINCTNADGVEESKEEKIVIKDKVLSQSAAWTMQQMAEDKPSAGAIHVSAPSRPPAPRTRVNKFARLTRSWVIASFALIVLLAATAVTLVFVLGERRSSDVDIRLPRCERLSTDVCLYSAFSFARNHRQRRPLPAPAQYVVVSQTFSDFCFDLGECLAGLKSWFEKDTPCNFLLGGDGNVYEDLGWGEETLHETPAANSTQICFMGDYFGWEIPTYPQVEAAKILIRYALANGFLVDNYSLVPSNATSAEPPGNSPQRFYYKSDWGGRPAKSFVLMKLPVPYVVVSHSASSPCSSLENCSPLIQGFQNYHQSINYADIAYNFLIDSSGNIYEGRGWDRRNVKGGFTNGRNIDVCVIGDFSDSTRPSDTQMSGLRFFLDLAVSSEYASHDYALIAANATYATLSPGLHVYDVIKHWPHFDPDPASHVKDFDT